MTAMAGLGRIVFPICVLALGLLRVQRLFPGISGLFHG